MSQEWWEGDYKHEYIHRENLKQQMSTVEWIYIGMDIRQDNIAKIGLTTKSLATSASCSQNPYYTLLCGFKIKEGVEPKKVREIEAAVINFIDSNNQRIYHYHTNRPSEWFQISPFTIRDTIHDFLYDNFSQYMYCYHCNERNVGVIQSWENKYLLEGIPRTPYKAEDLSSPPVSSDCYMQGGCGEDCDCWD